MVNNNIPKCDRCSNYQPVLRQCRACSGSFRFYCQPNGSCWDFPVVLPIEESNWFCLICEGRNHQNGFMREDGSYIRRPPSPVPRRVRVNENLFDERIVLHRNSTSSDSSASGNASTSSDMSALPSNEVVEDSAITVANSEIAGSSSKNNSDSSASGNTSTLSDMSASPTNEIVEDSGLSVLNSETAESSTLSVPEKSKETNSTSVEERATSEIASSSGTSELERSQETSSTKRKTGSKDLIQKKKTKLENNSIRNDEDLFENVMKCKERMNSSSDSD